MATNDRNNIDSNIHEAESMARAEQRKRKNDSTRRMNKLWMWLGVVILIFILLFWIFGIGTAEDIEGTDNGVQTEMVAPSPSATGD
ncbi:MAG: hypothetical protein K2N05_04795 [Muribaculaceae bacterium]|nr:hypothetical protein [Muribaculaceae bacterium]